MELTGKLIIVGETQTFNSGFQKREVVIQTEEQYPQEISVEFHKEKTSLADSYREGDRAKIHINIRGRYHEGTAKYYNTIVGWKIEKL